MLFLFTFWGLCPTSRGIFGIHRCQIAAPVADSGQTKRIFRGDCCYGNTHKKKTGVKDDADSQSVFSKWSFIFLAHIFLHFATPTCKVTSSSTPLYIQLPHPPQNIHFHLHLTFESSSKRFFFHQHNKHRPLGEQCKSRNSVKLLRNAVVMFPYPYPAPIYCHSTAKTLRLFFPVFSAPLIRHSGVEFCFNQAKTRPKKRERWQQSRFYGCIWRHQSSLQTLLSHFLLSKKKSSIKILTIDQSDYEFFNSGRGQQSDNNNQVS